MPLFLKPYSDCIIDVKKVFFKRKEGKMQVLDKIPSKKDMIALWVYSTAEF